MSGGNDKGYVMASAIAMLVAIGLVAAALVASSSDDLRRIRNAEAEAGSDAALRAALLLVGSQLTEDPRRRKLRLDGDTSQLNVFGHSIEARFEWEGAKTDVNLAPADEIRKALAAAHIDARLRSDVLAAIEQRRAANDPIRLLDDVAPDPVARDCLSTVLTVFGGRSDYVEGARSPTQLGRPAAGARLAVELWSSDNQRGLAAVILVTGDVASPTRTLDWRRMNRREHCSDEKA